MRFTKQRFFLYLMAAFYIAAGFNHFINTGFYLHIMPPYLPFPKLLVVLSGICETVLGILLLFKQTRRLAAWLIIVLLVCIFPANIQMTINNYNKQHPMLWVTILRLPLQIALIWWAYQYTRKGNLTL